MSKILTSIFILIMLHTGNLYADNKYKILVKVNDEIISNYDIEKEKSYLSALNPAILNIPEDEAQKIFKQSLIREIIKKKEISKFYDLDYRSPNLVNITTNLYTRLGINSEEEFKTYLAKYDLSLEDVYKKLTIETNWNALIYEKYKDRVNIDKEKIKKNLELEFSNPKKEKLFLLSEILFTAKDQKEYDNNYKKIITTIKEKDFKSAATVYSLSDTAKFGGEIGWVSKNDISEKIFNKVSNLKINEFTQPLKIGTGFLLINLDGIKEEKRNDNLEDKYNAIITKETNRRLNQYSNIYFKKIERQSFVYEK